MPNEMYPPIGISRSEPTTIHTDDTIEPEHRVADWRHVRTHHSGCFLRSTIASMHAIHTRGLQLRMTPRKCTCTQLSPVNRQKKMEKLMFV